MELLHQKTISSPCFKGFKIAPPAKGDKAIKYVLKKTERNYVDTFSFLTALTSMTGFAVGGYGLLSDQLHDIRTGKTKSLETKVIENKNISEKFKHFGPSSEQIILVSKKGSKEGAKTIVPSTKTAKIGLMFAKVGIAFSGIAGIFNGISMGLPLMAAGESLNLAASPIIETPLGTGLFGVALAAVFSGRALEHDPMLRLDLVKLSQKTGLKAKAGYILENVVGCAKEVLGTAKLFGKSIGHLFSTDKTAKTEAVSFFKNNVFSIKPKNLVFQEFINKEGIVSTKLAFRNNPYLMHAASLVLAIGGTTLALSSLLKKKTGQKVGLKTYEIGGSLDNLSLSRSGWEKAAMAGGPSGKLAGNLLGLSGLTILAGQPGVDEKWGRGTQWAGTALLFAVFAVERRAKAFNSENAKEAFTSLIRQHNIDLTKLFPEGKLGEKIANSEFKTRLDSIINFVKDEEEKKEAGPIKKFFTNILNKIIKPKAPVEKSEKIMEDETLNSLLAFAKEKIEGKSYQNDNFDFVKEFKEYTKNNSNISHKNIEAAIEHDQKDGKFRDGNFDELKKILEDESNEKFVSEEA